ncbi:MAG: DUF2723 domain-containing protein [Bacteroidales bacterium]|nr:DUF2723 domain-containing protein [Bacteroidales bacterium]
MNDKKFRLWHRLAALFSLAVSTVTYLLTIEPSSSFWDCGEFIASSYKLEVGHPPGNPVFQLIARFFTMFGDNMHAAILVNALSAVCSGLTIFFLYLTIVWLAKRLVDTKTAGGAAAAIGSGLVGALAYCFSDTFWFSAVEGEVYAMSSLFTAVVFWAMTMWYDRADEPRALRWIVLIAFLMGLSIGVHLLNLLAIPVLVFMFYYRRREDGDFTFWEFCKIFLIGAAILAFLVFLYIPYLPKLAAYFDLFFVNVLSLPYNSGAAFFLALLLGLCFWGLFATLKREKLFLNTALLCLTAITIGFSVFSIDIIRSCAKTPTNEYQPDNAFTLVRYLSREQYGSSPLLYGQYYDAPYDLTTSPYWAPMNGRYKKMEGPLDAKYRSEGKMLFPRMWSSSGDGKYEEFYRAYTGGRGKTIKGAKDKKPTMGANLYYFFDYQLGWMYWRYFMWNFAGRQNDVHSPSPGDIFHGNWECGLKFIDDFRLGDQQDAPALLKNNKGKNHYYLLPLLLGLLGLCFQFDRDKRGCWLTVLIFFMTGIAIVLYLNQPPFQVRERDYAYAGSFYFFCAWIGLAVAALYSWIAPALVGGKDAGKQAAESSVSGAKQLSGSGASVVEGAAGNDAAVSGKEKAGSGSNVAVSGNGSAQEGGRRPEESFAGVSVALALTVLCLFVPALMASENWDDHDRSNRATAVEMARNYLESVGPNGILITHGDNDTFPVWYAQEVENVRTDVRICNTSLLGTDWHIDQMKWACNESAPLPLSVGPEQYLYGVNEYVPIYDARETDMDIADVMMLFRHPGVKMPMSSGRKLDYIVSHKIRIPVNRENALASGIVPECFADMVPDSIVLNIPESKEYLTKPEIFMLDLLSNYEWDRPIHMLNMGGDINIGIKDYLMFEGYSYKFTPIKNKITTTDAGLVDVEGLYRKMTQVYRWDAISADNYFIDYQNLYTSLGVMPPRSIFLNCAKKFMMAGWNDRAVEMLDRACSVMSRYPIESISIGMSTNDFIILAIIECYYKLGEAEKAKALASQMGADLLETARFFLEFYDFAKSEVELCGSYIYYLSDIMKKGGDEALASRLTEGLEKLLEMADSAS